MTSLSVTSLNTRPLTASPPRFAWNNSNDRPCLASYLADIQPQDIQGGSVPLAAISNPYPVASLVERIHKALYGLDKPRFFVIRGLKSVLHFSLEQIRQFQWNLMDALAQKAGEIPRKSYWLDDRTVPSLTPTLPFHTDGNGYYPLFSLSYGPFSKNLSGAALPSVGDVRQFIMDHSDEIQDLFGWDSSRKHWSDEQIAKLLGASGDDQTGEHSEKNLKKNQLQRKFRENYGLMLSDVDPVNDIPIIILNNSPNGVVHAGSPLPDRIGEDYQRPIHRVYVSHRKVSRLFRSSR